MTGAPAANLAISRSQAEAVVAELIRLGVSRDRLVARGAGGEEGVVSEERYNLHRDDNRRVEFTLIERSSPGWARPSSSLGQRDQ